MTIAAIKIEANIDEKIFKLSRKILGLVNVGGSDAIVALCEDLDFLEPVPEKLMDLRSIKEQLKKLQHASKENSQVRAAILAGGDKALLDLEKTVESEKTRRGL